MRKKITLSLALPFCLAALCLAGRAAQIPEQDARNADIHDSNTHFKMPLFTSRESWLERAAFLRRQILASAGLMPMPPRGPIHAEVFGKIDHGGYTVEKVLLETYPGFYLGGNLYRPAGKQGPIFSRQWPTCRTAREPGRSTS
jgi:hypothetical protein